MLYFTICAAIIAVSALFAQVRQLQMLQQNSYFAVRYFKWLKDAFAVPLALQAILFCAFYALYSRNKGIVLLVLSVILLFVRIVISVKQHKKSIKKLVVTARIKRLFAAEAVFLIIPICIFALTKSAFIILLALGVVSPVLTYAAWAVTYPVEKAVSHYYISDAKRILKNHNNLIVIGITGSYGKTTTKFILNRILSEKYNTVCTPQSFNTPMGVVRTVRNDIKPSTQVFICEMGAKKTGDIKEICDIVHPNFGIITSVGPQHLDTFGSLDNVFKTKFELADEVRKNSGLTFINTDSPEILRRADLNDKSLVPFGENSEIKAENITCGPDGSHFTLKLGNTDAQITSRLLGKHGVCDIVAASALAEKLGVDINDIRFAVSKLKATPHRLELKAFNGGLLIDDAYNSNPEGCLAAVEVLGSFDKMKKVIITPGLIELGEKEYDCNYALGLAAAKVCDIIILVGKNRSKPMLDAINTTGYNRENVYVAESFKQAMEIYMPLSDNNSVVLLENDLPDNYLN